MRTLAIIAAAIVLSACCGRTGGTTAESAPAVAQTETTMIRLNVFVTTTPEHVAEVVTALDALAAASRAEAGCQGYEIYQSTIDPTRIFIVETWAGDEALNAHNESEHFKTILPPLGDKAQMKVERFDF